MKLATAKLTKLVITDAPNLDPIHVYAEDMGYGAAAEACRAEALKIPIILKL